MKFIQNYLHFPGLNQKVKLFVETCDDCQRYKSNGPGYGHLPLRDDYPVPFEEVALDHADPWTLDVPDIGKLQFYGLTVIAVTTSLLQIFRVNRLDAESSAMHFENGWLSRYLHPVRCIYDATSAFTAPPFQLALKYSGILAVPIVVKNPQSYAIVE